MKEESNLALFLMQGQLATKNLSSRKDLPPSVSLNISKNYDLSQIIPNEVNISFHAARAYQLFFIFENYLREIIVEILSKSDPVNWWDRIPSDVKEEVVKLEQTEEIKSWMALGSRDKVALLTYPQIIRVIDACWKEGFDDLIRDKTLLNETRAIGHLRNTLCHMTDISDEEIERIKQTMRDWFRIVAP